MLSPIFFLSTISIILNQNVLYNNLPTSPNFYQIYTTLCGGQEFSVLASQLLPIQVFSVKTLVHIMCLKQNSTFDQVCFSTKSFCNSSLQKLVLLLSRFHWSVVSLTIFHRICPMSNRPNSNRPWLRYEHLIKAIHSFNITDGLWLN